MLDIGIERVTERDHLHQWRKKHEEQRHRITPDHDELLEKDGAEATEWFSFHFILSAISPTETREHAKASETF